MLGRFLANCGAARASGNGHGCDVDDDSGDQVGLSASFSSAAHPSVSGVGREHSGTYERTHRRDFRHGAIPSEAGRRAGVERPHAPALKRASGQPKRCKSSSAKEQASC
jgi:hypothetical protein